MRTGRSAFDACMGWCLSTPSSLPFLERGTTMLMGSFSLPSARALPQLSYDARYESFGRPSFAKGLLNGCCDGDGDRGDGLGAFSVLGERGAGATDSHARLMLSAMRFRGR